MLLRLARFFRAGNIGRASFVYRHHGGVRGSSALKHAAADRYRVMLGYRQRLFRRIRGDFPIETFTPSADTNSEFASTPETLALLQRGCVILHHGLVQEAFTDLGDALAVLSSDDHDNPSLCEMLSRATNIEAWIWPDAVSNLRRLAMLLARTDARSIDTAFARGLYWQASTARRNGELIDTARLLGWMALFFAQCRYYRWFRSNKRSS